MTDMAFSQSSVEAGLLASCGQDLERFSAIGLAGITHEDFVGWGEVMRFMRGHVDQYNKLPTHDVLMARFPDWNPPQGEFAYWLSEIRRLTLLRRAVLAIKEAQSELEDDTEATVRKLANRLGQLDMGQQTMVLPTDATIGQRVEKYQLRSALYVEHGGRYIHGIPTGLAPIDSSGQGWMPGELVGILARPQVGKSWKLLRAGVLAWASKDRHRVLLISPEMPARQIALRVDVMIAHQLGIPMSHRKIYQGDPSQLFSYQQLAGIVSQNERWWTVDSIEGRAVGLADIEGLYRMFKPTMILIDGISLLQDDERGDSTWVQMKNVGYGLKRFATSTGVVIIASHQAVNSRKGARTNLDLAAGRGDDWVMPTMNDAAYGDAFSQAVSTCVCMCSDREERYVRWYSVRKSREREIEDVQRELLLWDVDSGRIEDCAGQQIDAIRPQLLGVGRGAGLAR